mmetsp:Transcript_11835/g.38006  ORF Transcript_11835/g.38006 Transcript_11835/m.38006 type:complete len:273 (-) Transcript_11835:44-862(-)
MAFHFLLANLASGRPPKSPDSFCISLRLSRSHSEKADKGFFGGISCSMLESSGVGLDALRRLAGNRQASASAPPSGGESRRFLLIHGDTMGGRPWAARSASISCLFLSLASLQARAAFSAISRTRSATSCTSEVLPCNLANRRSCARFAAPRSPTCFGPLLFLRPPARARLTGGVSSSRDKTSTPALQLVSFVWGGTSQFTSPIWEGTSQFTSLIWEGTSVATGLWRTLLCLPEMRTLGAPPVGSPEDAACSAMTSVHAGCSAPLAKAGRVP